MRWFGSGCVKGKRVEERINIKREQEREQKSAESEEESTETKKKRDRYIRQDCEKKEKK